MAITGNYYWKGQVEILKGNIQFSSDDLKVILLNASYSQDVKAHEFLSDISAYEVEGEGYTPGGGVFSVPIAVTSQPSGLAKVYIESALYYREEGSSKTEWTLGKVRWSALTIPEGVRYGLLYKNTGDPDTSPLIGCYNLGETLEFNHQDFGLLWQMGIIERIFLNE